MREEIADCRSGKSRSRSLEVAAREGSNVPSVLFVCRVSEPVVNMHTIVALATPLGRSGIGVVRLSGRQASAITSAFFVESGKALEPRTACLRRLIDPNTEETIDESVVTYFKAPASFTGEDVVEISCHGSPFVLRRVIDICLAAGARMAEPGEFTLRALANGRMDLAEAEAVRDLIDARSAAAARQAVRQMSGEFSHLLQPLKDELLDVIVVLESALEFVEDDLPETRTADLIQRLVNLNSEIRAIALTFEAGRLLREGIKVAIIGRPNVGKSSLFNKLLGTDRAIVTDIAGTTRDQLHEQLTIDEIPVSLIDTAGLRETTDTVESIGVERSRMTMADADIVIAMLDASEPATTEDRDVLDSVSELRHLVVMNKIDRVDKIPEAAGFMGVQGIQEPVIPLSAKTGEGIDLLKRALIEPFSAIEADTSGFLISDARHFDLLRRAGDEIDSSIRLLSDAASEEFVLVGLHNALLYLGNITGETTTEDMLTRIFSTFCIGK